jgi:hypothetical protein
VSSLQNTIPNQNCWGQVDGSGDHVGGGFLAGTEIITCKFVDFMNSYK